MWEQYTVNGEAWERQSHEHYELSRQVGASKVHVSAKIRGYTHMVTTFVNDVAVPEAIRAVCLAAAEIDAAGGFSF